jgi:hypothetical protein
MTQMPGAITAKTTIFSKYLFSPNEPPLMAPRIRRKKTTNQSTDMRDARKIETTVDLLQYSNHL